MTDITLTDVKSGYNLSTLNDNFDKVETVINEEVVHNTGGNNIMRQALDMNGHPVLNAGGLVSPSQIGYETPVLYEGGIQFGLGDNTKTIDRDGIVYAPLPSELPFTTTGTWAGDDEDKFFVVQGLTNQSPEITIRFDVMAPLLSDMSSPDAVELDYFDTSKIEGSGSKWIKDGSTGAASTTDFANGRVFNANGDGYKFAHKDIRLSQFGAKGDGTDEDSIINSALSYANQIGAHLIGDASGNYGITSVKEVGQSVKLIGELDAKFTVLSATTGSLFTVVNGGQIKGFEIDLNTQSFGSVLQIVPITSQGRIIFSNAYHWAEDITLTKDSSSNSGTAILLNAGDNGVADGSIQFTTCANIKGNYFENGVHIRATDNSFANSNSFLNVEMSRTTKPIFEEVLLNGTISTNIYTDFRFQWATGNQGPIFQDRARFTGVIWDGGTITFNGDNNFMNVMSSSLFDFDDNGEGNHIIGHAYEYFEGRTTWNGDTRPRLTGFRGKREFIDEFQGDSLGHPWKKTDVGATSITIINNYRGAAPFKFVEQGLKFDTGTVANDSFEINFGGNGGYGSELNPEMRATFRITGTTDQNVFIGYYKDSNNYIGIELAGAAGNIELVSKSIGVETRTELKLIDDGTTPLTNSFNYFYFMTLKIDPVNGATCTIGAEVHNSTNLYQALFLQEKTTTAYTATNTTNVPVEQLMEPRFFCETTVASPASLTLLDCQLYSTNGYSD